MAYYINRKRKKLIIKNIIASGLSFIISYLLSFILVKVALQSIGSNLWSIRILFTNIIGILCLSSSIIESAIRFELYEPLHNNDVGAIQSIISYFSKLYKIIGIITFVIGLAIIPLIPHITNSNLKINFDFAIGFIIVLTSSCINYYIGYKKILFLANQQEYKIKTIEIISSIVFSFINILCLYLFENLYYYLILILLENITMRLFYDRFTIKHFPDIKRCKTNKNYDKFNIIKNIKSLLLSNFGDLVIYNSDIILISTIVGLTYVNIYNNYIMILWGFASILQIINTSATSTIGNLIVSKTNTSNIIDTYYVFLYVSTSVLIVLITGFYLLVNQFIVLWIGSDYLLPHKIVTLLSLTYFISHMRIVTQTYSHAYGLFYQNRYKGIIEACINIILSIILGIYFGLYGILIATFISIILVSFWFEPYILFNFGFKKSIKPYIFKYIKYTCIAIVNIIINYYLLSLIQIDNNIIQFIVKGIIVVIASPIIYFGLTCKTNEAKKLLYNLKNIT